MDDGDESRDGRRKQGRGRRRWRPWEWGHQNHHRRRRGQDDDVTTNEAVLRGLDEQRRKARDAAACAGASDDARLSDPSSSSPPLPPPDTHPQPPPPPPSESSSPTPTPTPTPPTSTHTDAPAPTAPQPPPRHIPGFTYDHVRGRYFRTPRNGNAVMGGQLSGWGSRGIGGGGGGLTMGGGGGGVNRGVSANNRTGRMNMGGGGRRSGYDGGSSRGEGWAHIQRPPPSPLSSSHIHTHTPVDLTDEDTDAHTYTCARTRAMPRVLCDRRSGVVWGRVCSREPMARTAVRNHDAPIHVCESDTHLSSRVSVPAQTPTHDGVTSTPVCQSEIHTPACTCNTRTRPHTHTRVRRGGYARELLGGVVRGADMHCESLVSLIPSLQDLDYRRGRLATASRDGQVTVIEKNPRHHLLNMVESLSCATPVNCVRWRPVGDRADVLALAEAGDGASAAAIVISRRLAEDHSQDDDAMDVQVMLERFQVRHETVWTLAWERSQGTKIVAGVSKKQPLLIIDVPVARLLTHTRAESDIFSTHFTHDGHGLLCGGRSGKVWCVDLRTRGVLNAGPGVVATMTSSIDHMHTCNDQQRLVVSDRAGAVHVVDVRYPGRTFSRLTGHPPPITHASAFAIDPTDTLCITPGSDGCVRVYDIHTGGPPITSWDIPLASATRGGSASATKRWFIAPTWLGVYSNDVQCVGKGLGGVSSGSDLLWAPLWAGCRTTGVVYSVNLHTKRVKEGCDTSRPMSIFGT